MDIGRLLAEKFPDKDTRATAAALISACGQGLREDQTIALIHELAQPSDMSGEDSARYIGSFLSSIGAPDYVSQRFTSWIDAGTATTQPGGDKSGDAATAADVGALNPPAPVVPTIEQMKERAAGHLRDLSSAPGSEAWTRYWRGGGQAEYFDTLRALEAAPISPAPAPQAPAEPAA